MKIPSLRSQKRARIEIIPLIDIIFFLLATFVMVSMSMVKNQGIPLNLPSAATSASQERKDYTAISVTEGGDLFFNKEKISTTDLTTRLERLVKESVSPKIFINGDAKADFGLAVQVLDEVRRLGITQVAIETKVQNKTP
jgi:biopolymer transport protein ExbD